jgi:hypothetical protein
MVSSLASVTLACALASTGGLFHPRNHQGGGRILPPGPPPGWGFPNGNPDGYGFFDHGTYLPLGADRTGEYYFPRYYAMTPEQLVMPSYYNPYLSRGQRYIPYANCGGAHPMGGPPQAPANLPVHPYNDSLGSGPTVAVPAFTGNVAAPPINPGSTGLTP